MYKCPNKNLPEWKELEKVVPEVAYTIWDMNNGHGIDKAPEWGAFSFYLINYQNILIMIENKPYYRKQNIL